MTSAVTPGLGWPVSDRYPGGPDVPSAPSALGWPAPRPPAPPVPRTPVEAAPEPVPPAYAEHAAEAASEEAPEGAAEPVSEIAPSVAAPVESTPPVESAAPADSAQPEEAAEAVAPEEPADRTEPAHPTEPVDPTEPADQVPAAAPPVEAATERPSETPATEAPAVSELEPVTAASDTVALQPAELPAPPTDASTTTPPDAAAVIASDAEAVSTESVDVPTPVDAAYASEAPTGDETTGAEAEAPEIADAPDEADGNAGAAYRESLVRDAMARVASPNPPPDVSRETWHDTAAAGHTVPDVSRETEPEPQSELAAFIGDDTPIAAAAAAALRTTRSEPFPKPARPRVLTVANQKGGVGKTTTTVNIAAGLALRGLDVLVIDLDPQGNASTALGIAHTEGTPSVYDVLVADKPMESVVRETAVPGLFCAPATVDLAGAEIELVPVVARENRLKRALAGYKRSFDYVFIDCPPSLGLLTVNALVAANEIVIPIQCEFYALEGLGQLLRNVELIRSHLNADLWVSTILLTMYDSRTKLADQVASEVRGHFGDLVLDSAIPRSVRISEAPGYGQTVLTYDPASRGAQAYLAAAREIAERGARMTEGS